MEKVIEVKNLTKEYKEQKAVDNLSFDVYEGEILGSKNLLLDEKKNQRDSTKYSKESEMKIKVKITTC